MGENITLSSSRQLLRRICLTGVVIIFVLVAVGFTHMRLNHRYGSVELSNGMRLVNTSWQDQTIALVTPTGEQVVAPDIDGITWNEHYVLGWRMMENKMHTQFIYKMGDTRGVDQRSNAAAEFKKKLQESGLETSEEAPPRHYVSNLRNYLELREDAQWRRAWYE